MLDNLILSQIHSILSYNLWANNRLIENLEKIKDADYIKQLPVPFGSINKLLQHLVYYDMKCFHQITESLTMQRVEEKLPKTILAEKIVEYANKWLAWIKNLNANDKTIAELKEVLSKVIDVQNHNTYHRAQINTIISMLGYKPESLDIYHYNELIKPN